MAVIIQFPLHARAPGERPDQPKAGEAVVLPFAPTRRMKARSRQIERSMAERQASGTAVAIAPSARRD
jgi:hypothetical protein